ncbi:uncharacterized protein LTR77_005604 [Saxophila tyrrhenica]|uniref:Major facilitator superfamily (MFS) profile domain-containing protein n=1 Tax=Saxophila tyrrhenica TaxID=1690608 RepID=A0AAV9PC15_9PEZI|nr:hypothetical protein LTR77_005604 [Saxophila tyrrhenica]
MSTTTVETVLEQPRDRQYRGDGNQAGVGSTFGATIGQTAGHSSVPEPRASLETLDPATGTQTPEALLSRDHSRLQPLEQDVADAGTGLELSNPARESYELQPTVSLRGRPSTTDRQPSQGPLPSLSEQEAALPRKSDPQGIPPELGNFASEVIFVLVCSAGQLLFGWFLGDVNVNQQQLRNALGIENTQLPWLVGAFNIANGLSVMLSGSLTDLVPPKFLIVGAFIFLTIWNTVGAFSLTPQRAILFFVVRAMQGLAVGTLVSGSMSILGRVYNPGIRKTRVFSAMAAMAPSGFWIGSIQGGALTAHLPWVFGSNAMLCGLCAIAAFFTIPALKPAADIPGTEAPSLRQFDYIGALLAVSGSVCLLFGLTQGSVTQWSPYTYALVVAGILLLAAFFYAESRVPRPLIPTRLWKTPGFAPLMLAYFLGFGAYISWQFYAIQFWLRIQHASPLTVALYLLPNLIAGIIATYIVSRIMHLVPGHWIYVCAMLAFATGPAFFLPQTAGTSYWALSMPGIALCTFGPDLSFAAASIFITSNVARSYQGSAGSLLMTVQNLSAAIVTSVADAIGAQVALTEEGEVGLEGLRAIWWFGLAAAVVGAGVTVVGVRIPREEEKEHVT